MTLMITQFYGFVQAGLSGLALSTARANDPRTMAVTALGLGLVTLSFCTYGYVAVSPLTALLGFEMSVIVKMLVPYSLLGLYLVYVGLAGMGTSSVKEPTPKSGRVMALCSLFAILQGVPLVFFTDAWLDKFVGEGAQPMH